MAGNGAYDSMNCISVPESIDCSIFVRSESVALVILRMSRFVIALFRGRGAIEIETGILQIVVKQERDVNEKSDDHELLLRERYFPTAGLSTDI